MLLSKLISKLTESVDSIYEKNSLEVVKALQKKYPKTYYVGGYVRDKAMGLTDSKDIDIATEATPAQVKAVLDKAFPGSTYVEVGESFGIVMIVLDGERIEIASFRKDGEYSDSRRPDSVEFASDKEDAARRDFTINSIFFNPINGEYIDHFSGREDIKGKKIKAVGDPHKRFEEDALRMMRAVRFMAQKDFQIDKETYEAIKQNVEKLTKVSKERIKEEMDKILKSSVPDKALEVMKDLGMLEVLFPEVAALEKYEQNPEHHPEGNCMVHTFLTLKHSKKDLILRWALLFHDLGKQKTAINVEDPKTGMNKIKHPGHPFQSVKMAREILDRYKFSSDEKNDILWLVDKHDIFMNWKEMGKAKKITLMAHPLFDKLLDHYEADRASTGSAKIIGKTSELLNDIKEYTKEVKSSSPALEQASKFTIVTGEDLKSIGIKQGPLMGELLKNIKEKYLEGELTSKEELLDYVKTNLIK